MRYAAEMASLEEGIAQANAAVESMTPVAAEMAASVDASFATIDEAVSALVPALVDAEDNIVALNVAVAETGSTLAGFAATATDTTGAMSALAASQADVEMAFLATAQAADGANAAHDALATAINRAGAAADRASIGFDILAAAEDAASASATTLIDIAAGIATALAIVAAVVGVVGIAVAGVSAKLAGDFQAGLTSLVTGAGEAQKNIQMVGDGILALAPKVGQTTGSLIAGMYQIESAGFHGAKGLEVLTAAAEGAKVGSADLADVANGVTTAMTDYAATGLTAAQATNTLIAAVSEGKTHVADLSTAFSTILPTAAAAGVSFRDTAGALATMTGEGTDAASAATYLRQTILALEAPSKAASTTLKSVGLTTQQVASEMKVSLPGAMQLITDAVGKKFPEGSAAYIDALKNIFGGTKQLQGALELTGTHLKTFQDNVNGIADSVKKGGNAITGWANVQGDFNTKMAQAGAALEVVGIKIGTLLLPVLSGLMDKINPLITAFGNWVTSSKGLAGILGAIGDAFNQVFNPVQKLAPVLSPVNDAFDRTKSALAGMSPLIQPIADAFDRTKTALAALAPVIPPISDAFDRTKTGLANITHVAEKAQGPWIDFFTGVKRVVDFLTSIDWGAIWHGLQTAVQNVWGALSKVDWGAVGAKIGQIADALSKVDWGGIGNKIGQIATVIQKTLWPAAQDFAKVLQHDLIPAIQRFMPVLQPLLPLLGQLALAIGGTLLLAMMLAAAWITGLAKGFSGFLDTISNVTKSCQDFATNVKKVFSDMLKFVLDLTSGKFDELGKDWDNLKTDVGKTLGSLKDIVTNLFGGMFDTVKKGAAGFIKSLEDSFTGLYNALVGHSIIPDMITSIVASFASLPGRAMSAVQGLAGQLGGFFSGLASQAVGWGQSLIQGVINGITSMFGNVSNAMSNLAGLIGSWLPHSPAKQGELSHLNEYGPSLVKGISQGIVASQPLLQASLDLLMRPVGQAMHVQSAAPVSTPVGSSTGGGKREVHVHVHIAGHEIGHYIADDVGEVVVDRLRSHGVKVA